VARLRILGEPDAVVALRAAVERLDEAEEADVVERLLACCGARSFAERLAAARPFGSPSTLFRHADEIWRSLDEADWLEAFAAHPEIGGGASAAGATRSASWSSDEQAGVRGAGAATLDRLAELNRAYRERFGFLYLVCATGRGADEMLALLECRLHNDRATELRVAAEEQRRITALRLLKLLESP